jgi:hypothetical protein
MEEEGGGRTWTWPQIRYWVVAIVLAIIGLGLLIGAQFIPWEGARFVVSEIGIASLIASLLAGVVEPFFRGEFARDAFLAAFRYVLPKEFREEVEKILKFDFIAEKQVWTVNIEKVNNEVVLVTTTYERTIRNKTKSNKPASAWYEAEDYRFAEGSTKLECAIEYDTQILRSSTQTEKDHEIEAKTSDLMIPPDKSARIWGKGTQYRRINDSMFETFRFPIVNPKIEVILDEKEFSHTIAFGTHGDWRKSEYGNHYTLSGVYFPGQFMWVRWWPKASAKITSPA